MRKHYTTLIMGWLAYDSRGPCSACIARDSGISNGINHYDNSKKLFALRNMPDILGDCGETMFINQGLSTITNICDENRLLFCKVNNIHLELMELILTAKVAENQHVGGFCGKLDQNCEVLFRKNHLLYLDTKDDSCDERKKLYEIMRDTMAFTVDFSQEQDSRFTA